MISFVNFIEFFNTKNEALSIKTSPSTRIHTFTGIQLLPNNTNPYIQTTNVSGGIELEDWTVYVVNLCTGEETDVTSYFLVDRIFQDTNGQNQFDWKLTNVPFDFGNNLVYLKAEQAIGETFYSNVFQLTSNNSEKTARLDYRDKLTDTMQSIQLQMYYWQSLKNTEINSYYQVSTRNTVTTLVKSQKYERWVTEFIPNDLMIKIDDIFENKYVYVDLVRANLFEANEIKEFSAEEDFKENILKISFISNDVYDPLYVAPVVNTNPSIVLNSVVANGVNAIYDFTVSDFTPTFLTFQTSQDQVNWNSTNNGSSSTQSIAFTGTGTWYFRVIHPQAESNIIQLNLGDSVVANNDSIQVAKGQTIDIPVLFNDVLVGNTTITSVTAPTNGTATIIESGTKIRYTHNDNTAVFDSFSYTIGNGITSDSATVSVTITASEDDSTAFSISDESAISNIEACSFALLETVRWHNGNDLNPMLNDFVFTDAGLTTPLNGNNEWFVISGGRVIKINSLGKVIDVYICGT